MSNTPTRALESAPFIHIDTMISAYAEATRALRGGAS